METKKGNFRLIITLREKHKVVYESHFTKPGLGLQRLFWL
jgi:hypothetical protein